MTESGSAYRLGERALSTGGVRRSSRAAGKDSLLDAFAEKRHAVLDVEGLTYEVGGADVGGSGAERIMRGAFSVLDDNLVMLRSQYSAARRVVLYKADTPVAASVVEVTHMCGTAVLVFGACASLGRECEYGDAH